MKCSDVQVRVQVKVAVHADVSVKVTKSTRGAGGRKAKEGIEEVGPENATGTPQWCGHRVLDEGAVEGSGRKAWVENFRSSCWVLILIRANKPNIFYGTRFFKII